MFPIKASSLTSSLLHSEKGRTGLRLLPALVLIVLFGSCTTTRWVNTGGYWLESVDTPDSVAHPTLSDEGVYADDDMMVTLEMLDDCFSLKLVNRSGHPLTIVWNESTYTDELGEEHPLMHTEAADIGHRPQASTKVAKGATLEDFVAPFDGASLDEEGYLVLKPLWDLHNYKKKADAVKACPEKSFVTVTLAIQYGTSVSKYYFDFAGTDYETTKIKDVNYFGTMMIPIATDFALTFLVLIIFSIL